MKNKIRKWQKIPISFPNINPEPCQFTNQLFNCFSVSNIVFFISFIWRALHGLKYTQSHMTLCKCWAHEKMGDLQNGVMGQNRLSNSAWEVLLMYHLCYRMTSACQSEDATSPDSYSPCRHLETCWDAVKGECEISPSR